MADYKGDWNDLFQFVESQQPGSGADKDATKSIQNDAFALYPQSSRTVGLTTRTTGTNFEQTTRVLPKGFIRNLVTKQGGELAEFPNIRCNFQFNPQDIQHQIEARKDMYLPILQDPTQLSQPMAGNATFAFELIFDRTMEVNSRFSSNDPNNEGMPDPDSAETVGVFHDLRVLHSIIGQGLSAELMEAQLAKLNRDVKKFASLNYKQLNIRASQNTDDTFTFTALTAEGTDAGDDVADQDLNSRNTANFLTNIDSANSGTNNFMANLNVGNSAFLIPQPCRVIFSPMFMVDGFVMNTNVLFTKFSAKMIPIQCKVHLQMQAIYIGFARSKTFITEQIAETEKQNDEEQIAYDTNLTDIESLIKLHLNTITVGYNSDQRILADEGPIYEMGRELESVETTNSGENQAVYGMIYQPFWMFVTKDFWYNRPAGIIGGTQPALSKPIPDTAGQVLWRTYDPHVLLNWNNPELTPYGSPGITVKLCMNKAGADNIKKLIFENMSSDNPVLDIAVKSYIYGPFTEPEAITFRSTVSPVPRDLCPPNTRGIYSGGYKFTNKKDWEKWTKTPKNWTLALSSYDPMHNGANKGSYPINIQTPNSAGKNVVDTLNEKLQELDHYSTDAVNARGLYTQNSTNNIIEITDPAWRTDIPSSHLENGFNAVPIDLYYTLPDSLLYLVDETHNLNDKYFVVITTSSIIYNVTSPGEQIGKGLVAKNVSIVKGNTTDFIVDMSPA